MTTDYRPELDLERREQVMLEVAVARMHKEPHASPLSYVTLIRMSLGVGVNAQEDLAIADDLERALEDREVASDAELVRFVRDRI